MPRERLPLVFGTGLDRYSGAAVVEPASMRDLRNVDLRVGRAALRNALVASLDFAPDDTILATHAIHSQGIGAAVTYNSATREVNLWLMANDGSVRSFVALLWTFPAGADVPVVIVDDSYDKLFIAHDEPFYANRMQTMVYDPSAGTTSGLVADLDNDGTSGAVKFRGVKKRLSYMMGWGHGTEAAGQGDRPEIIRTSLPADPLTWVPEHYFVAGQRNEPILACDSAGNVLAVRKANESYRLVGFSRTNFGIEPMDTEYGAIASRLSVTVNNRNYFWSLDGPRSSLDGASVDLALPLDVTGAVPDAKAVATDPRYGFAFYVPRTRQIWFVFGAWAYVLSLGTPEPAWSYHEFGSTLMCGGVLYSEDAVTLGTLAYPFVSLDFDAERYTAGDADHNDLVVKFTPQGPLSGDEVAEVWLRPQYGATGWYKAGEITPVIAGENTATYTTTIVSTPFDVAVRFRSGGLYQAAYNGSPSLWPAASRATTNIAWIGLDALHDHHDKAIRTDGTHTALRFRMAMAAGGPFPTPALQPQLKMRLYSRTGGGAWAVEQEVAWDGTATWMLGALDGAEPGLRDYLVQLWTDLGAASDTNDRDVAFPNGWHPIAHAVAYEFPTPYNATATLVGPKIRIDWMDEDVGAPTSCNVIISRSVDGGAWADIHTQAYAPSGALDGVTITGTYQDAILSPHTYEYRVRYEVLAFGVTDVYTSATTLPVNT